MSIPQFRSHYRIGTSTCPPQRPDKDGFVERYNRTYEYEGIRTYRPATFDQAVEMNQAVCQHYNFERPNGWLKAVDEWLYIRRVNHSGTVKVDKRVYYRLCRNGGSTCAKPRHTFG